MKTKWFIGIAFWVLFILALASSRGKIIDLVLIGLSMIAAAAGILYKLALWFRYRDVPVKRAALISSAQVYPKWLAKFIFDEWPQRPSC